jgi:hypothetical protein
MEPNGGSPMSKSAKSPSQSARAEANGQPRCRGRCDRAGRCRAIVRRRWADAHVRPREITAMVARLRLPATSGNPLRCWRSGAHPIPGKGNPAARILSSVWHCNSTATINYKPRKDALNRGKAELNSSISFSWGVDHAPEYLFAVNCVCRCYFFTGDHDCNCGFLIGKSWPSQLHGTTNFFGRGSGSDSFKSGGNAARCFRVSWWFV